MLFMESEKSMHPKGESLIKDLSYEKTSANNNIDDNDFKFINGAGQCTHYYWNGI